MRAERAERIGVLPSPLYRTSRAAAGFNSRGCGVVVEFVEEFEVGKGGRDSRT